MSSSKNLEIARTSFLNKSNSTFIEQMYMKFIENDPDLPLSWENYFRSLGEDLNSVAKEIEGPNWKPNKKKIKININQKNIKSDIFLNEKTLEESKSDSIKAIALIRAYRIRGHLIANLDPLGMREIKYLHELHPDDHGFKKEDYDKKIYLYSYLDKKYASINEIIPFLKKIYCSSIGVEYMHIADPIEKKWFRERMEKKEKQLNFTDTGKQFILIQF